jgi:hypothetical protein
VPKADWRKADEVLECPKAALAGVEEGVDDWPKAGAPNPAGLGVVLEALDVNVG